MSTETKLYFTVRDQVFTVTLYGLRPSTTHYCYFERNLVSASQIKPLNGNLGDPIVTDVDGKATFDFYYQSGASTAATSIAEGQRLAASIAGTKELCVVNQSQASLGIGFEETSDSFFSTQLQISVYLPPENEYQIVNKPYQAPVEVAAPVVDNGYYVNTW